MAVRSAWSAALDRWSATGGLSYRSRTRHSRSLSRDGDLFARLVKEGRDIAEISTTFGLPELGVTRILAPGNLMPRIRTLYRDGEIDAVTVRHLTMASKRQQRAWLALYDEADAWVPSGHQLKAWLLAISRSRSNMPCSAPKGWAGSSPTCSARTAILPTPMPSGARRLPPSRNAARAISRRAGPTR